MRQTGYPKWRMHVVIIAGVCRQPVEADWDDGGERGRNGKRWQGGERRGLNWARLWGGQWLRLYWSWVFVCLSTFVVWGKCCPVCWVIRWTMVRCRDRKMSERIRWGSCWEWAVDFSVRTVLICNRIDQQIFDCSVGKRWGRLGIAVAADLQV
jgi:hypothetical protein